MACTSPTGRELDRATVSNSSLLILCNIYHMGHKTTDGAVEPLPPIFCVGSVLHLCYYSSDSTGEEGWIAVQLPRQSRAHVLPDCEHRLSIQLFKGVCDISHGAVLIPDRISDYRSFILDQAIQQRDNAQALRRAAIVSVTMSFAAFSVMAACTLLTGYKHCKRIIW